MMIFMAQTASDTSLWQNGYNLQVIKISNMSKRFIFSWWTVLMHSMIGYWRHTIVCPSVCNAVHRDAQSRYV